MREPPAVVITQPAVGGVYYSDVHVELMATVSDAEDPGDLVVAWAADDEPLDADAPAQDGQPDPVLLAPGEQRITATVTDPDGKSASAAVSIVVLAGNTAPTCSIESPDDGQTVAPGTDLQLRAVLSDAEAPPEWLTASWSSDVDGPLLSTSTDSTGVTTGSVSLTAGVHVLTLTGADERSLTCTDSVTVTVGDPPTVAITAPADGLVFGEGSVVDFAALVDDPVGDPALGQAAWSSDLDGTFGFSTPEATGAIAFSSDALSVGGHVVTLTFTSAGGLSGTDVLGVTINGAPTLSRLDISPAIPETGEALTATPTATDPEGDPLDYAWTWTKDGVVQADLESDTVEAGRIGRGEVWAVQAVATDGWTSSASQTDSVTVANATPSVTSATISPNPLTVATSASAALAATDPEGDAVTWGIAWEVNGVSAGTGASLGAAAYSRGDTVEMTATPSDGLGNGASVTDTLTVSNAPPAIHSVAISPASPEELEDDLVCVIDAVDADGDALAWTISWTVDGAPYTGTVHTTSVTGDTIWARDTGSTLEWSCTAVADDGLDSVSVTSAVAALRASFSGWGSEFDIGAAGGAGDPWSWVGYGGAVPLDVNGDGVDELLVGSDRPLVYAFTVASLTSGYSIDTSFAIRTVESAAGDTDLGVGDIDGDGDANDLVVFGGDGNTYVVTRSTLVADPNVIASAEADWRITSTSATVGADGSVADVDGDGLDDIIASSSDDYSVRVMSGADLRGFYADYDSAAAWLTLPTGDWWGLSVAATDWDGDGLADIAAGSDADAVCVWPGDTVWPGTADMCSDGLQLVSPEPGEYAGERVQAAGDVDGDGTADLLVPAAYGDAVGTDSGRLYVVRGADMAATGWAGSLDLSASWLVLEGERSGDAFGFSVGAGTEPAATADVDGDGRADLIVSSYGGDDSVWGYGATYLFLAEGLGGGTFSAADADTRFYSTDYFFVSGIGSAGDVNADGFEDLWFALPSYSDGFDLVLSH